MDSTINITLSSDIENSGNPTAPQDPGGQADIHNPTQSKSNSKNLKDFASFQVGEFVLKRSVNYASSRVGIWTGSQNRQDQVNAVMKGIGFASAIAINPVLGVGTIAFDLATNLLDYKYNKEQESLRIAREQRRSGSNINRSRWR